MNFYRVLRDNKELGPFSLDEIRKLGLRTSDLIWVDGQSAAWRFSDEVPGLFELIGSSNAKTEDNTPQDQHSFISKPKKRYRLTADHRMVEITEEEAKSSALPRIEDQPPAPKDFVLPSPSLNQKPLDGGENNNVPPDDLPFSKRRAVEDTSFPLEPELSNMTPVLPEKKETIIEGGFLSEPFGKKGSTTKEDIVSLPLEPELTSSSQDKFEELESDKKHNMEEEHNAPNNTGAFVLAGLLFLVAIGFFGYKWYKDQQPQNVQALDNGEVKGVDSLSNGKTDGFENSKSIAINDDTLGQFQRLSTLKAQDSVKRLEAAKAERLAAIQKAKVDSIQIAQEAQPRLQDVAESMPSEAAKENTNAAIKLKKDSTKENKVNKIRTTEDIGKYVRVGVVQPKSQTNGVSGVKLVIHNINNRNLAKVHINVIYFDNNGNIIKKNDIIAPNITIGKSVTVPVADNSAAAYVSYKVTGLLGDHVNLQAK